MINIDTLEYVEYGETYAFSSSCSVPGSFAPLTASITNTEPIMSKGTCKEKKRENNPHF